MMIRIVLWMTFIMIGAAVIAVSVHFAGYRFPVMTPTGSSSLQTSISPSLSPAEDKIQTKIDSMNLDEKIGQMVIGGYDNIDEILPVIRENKLGGVLLFQKNIISISQAKQDIQSLKQANSMNKNPIFVAVDQEGGNVDRLPAGMGPFESALSIGDRNDAAYAFNSGVKIAKALKQLGFNLDFAPVLDIFSNPQNTVIADRAYGTTPQRVSEIGIQVMKGLQSENIIATAKHFPGHGDTQVDSHFGLPVVDKSIEELNGFEFIPFKNAIENGVDIIMMAHIMLSQVDDVPSSLSDKVVTGVLRERLGFHGVVITDDIAMGAITESYSVPTAAVKAVNAGCDIVLVSQGAQNSVLVMSALKSAVQNGQLTERRINESVYRILSLKEKYKL